MEKLYRKYKSALVFLGIIIGFLGLTLVFSNFLIGRINSVRTEAEQIHIKSKSLESRIATLQAAASSVRELVDTAAIAIPEKNPSILITRQLREKAKESGVTLDDYTITSGGVLETSTMENYEVSFKATGENYTVVSGFVIRLGSLLPLINLSSVSVRQSSTGSNIEANIRLVAYSAPYPEALPSLDTPLSGLSPMEQESLNTLELFDIPTFSATPPQSTEIVPRQNPFSLEL